MVGQCQLMQRRHLWAVKLVKLMILRQQIRGQGHICDTYGWRQRFGKSVSVNNPIVTVIKGIGSV